MTKWWPIDFDSPSEGLLHWFSLRQSILVSTAASLRSPPNLQLGNSVLSSVKWRGATRQQLSA
eukprot:gene8124-1374_t